MKNKNIFSLSKIIIAISALVLLISNQTIHAQTASEKIVFERGHPAKKHLFSFEMRLKEGERSMKKNLKPSDRTVREAREEFDKAKALAPTEKWKPYETRLLALESSLQNKKEEVIARIESQESAKKQSKLLKQYLRDVGGSARGNSNKPLPRVSGKIYYESAQKADWKAYQEATSMGSDASILDIGTENDFTKNYPSFVDNVIIPAAYFQLDKTSDNNLGEAMEAALNALGYAKGALIFLPNKKELNVLKNKAESKVSTLKDMLVNELSGPFHVTHIGELLTANKKINIGSESIADFTTSFSAEESIYLISYWRQHIKKETSGGKYHPEGLNSIEEVGLTIKVDNERELYVKIPTLGENKGTSSVVQVCVTPALSALNVNTYNYEQIQAFIKLYSFLKNFGNRPLNVTISFGSIRDKYNKGSVPLFKTNFLLNGNQEYFQKALTKAKEILIEATRMPKKGASNPTAEAMAKAFIEKENGPVLCVVTAEGWYVSKNELGVPIRKFNKMYVAYKSNDGQCYYRPVNATRDYKGGGSYEAIAINGGESIPMKCANVNK